MSPVYHETIHKFNDTGIHLAFHTTPGGYHPLHWHEDLEILYPLNGDADIRIDGNNHVVLKKHLIVINPRQAHSSYAHGDTHMFLCIHISQEMLKKYIPDILLVEIHCYPDRISTEEFPAYLEICKKLEEVTKLYIQSPSAANIESEGLILQALALLIRHFSVRKAEVHLNQTDTLTGERLLDVITYVEEHFRDPISTRDAAVLLSLGEEYFCRFFRKNMGMSFLQYVNEVRITHIYRDLIRTDTSVTELMERNGFTNQKLFNRTFKAIYGCTPSSVRKRKGKA